MNHMTRKSGENIWSIYMIECADDTIYTGVSINIERRLKKHLSGKGAKYLRPACRQPFKFVVSVTCDSKSTALKTELKVKDLTHGQKLELMAMWKSNPTHVTA